VLEPCALGGHGAGQAPVALGSFGYALDGRTGDFRGAHVVAPTAASSAAKAAQTEEDLDSLRAKVRAILEK